MLSPDTILQNRYRIVRQLGQGGMGAVYEALDLRLDTTIALKETFFVDDRLRKQFEREARLLARLHHPALPRVSDHFSEIEGQFLVMQFIGGDDLFEKLSHRRGPFPADQVTAWADQLLDALDYLHTQDPQIIHRDIKPQNLKVTSRGQIILLDFGLAKGQGSEISRVTTSASIFGYTPNYAPLEQIQGLGTDARSDLYALAATLYHLITAVKPPDALTRAAAIVNSQPDPLQRANELNPDVSPQLAGALQRAMAQNREQRYATAAEMRHALRASSDAITVSSRSEAETVLFPTATTTSSGTTQAGLSPLTAVSGETTAIRHASMASRGTRMWWAISALAVVVLGAGIVGLYAHQNGTAPAEQPAVVAATPEAESPSPNDANSASVDDTQVEATDQDDTTEQTARKSERSSRERTAKKKTSQSTTPEEHEESTVIVVPEPPAMEWSPKVPRTRPPRHPTGVTVRTFPDGTQLITSPDGRRILVTPDGKKKLLRPGEKVTIDKAPTSP